LKTLAGLDLDDEKWTSGSGKTVNWQGKSRELDSRVLRLLTLAISQKEPLKKSSSGALHVIPP
jgi:hypothetical protein